MQTREEREESRKVARVIKAVTPEAYIGLLDHIDVLEAERDRLKAAIVAHRSQKADDRCIEDDDRLYEALGDGIKCDRRVGDKQAMLTNCARFIERRCEGGGWPSYAELEKERNELRANFEYSATHNLQLLRQIEDLRKERDDLQASADLRWRADQRAIKRWQEAIPGNDMTWPGHVDLCCWLLGKLDAIESKRDKLERQLHASQLNTQSLLDKLENIRKELALLKAERDAAHARIERLIAAGDITAACCISDCSLSHERYKAASTWDAAKG